MPPRIFLLVAILTLLNISSALNSGSIKEIGENCDLGIPNDCGSLWEECGEDEKCRCKDLFHTDEDKHECVGFIGNSCYDKENVKLGCVKNSFCYKNSSIEGEGICVCPKNHLPGNKNEICLGGHLESCENNNDCYEIGLLECNSETKQCDCPINSRWEENSDKGPRCRFTLGGNCEESKPGDDYGLECSNSLNLACLNGKCECKTDYKGYGEGCYVALFRGCDSSNVCHPQFYCSPSTRSCICSHGYEANEREECTALSNTKCLYEGQQLWDCTENANCAEDGLCRCDEPKYQHGFFSKCFLSHQQPCNFRDECSVIGFLNCTHNSICECENGYEYETNVDSLYFGQCLAEVDRICPYDPYNSTNRMVTCVGGSSCSGTKCICRFPLEVNPYDNKCYAKKNYECKSNSIYPYEGCHPAYFLTCSEDRCICQEDYSVDSSFDCIGTIGAICKTPEGYEPRCIRNAECVQKNGDLFTCECEENFHEFEATKKICFGDYNVDCSDGYTDCNGYKYMHCDWSFNNTKVCQCNYDTIYDKILNICRGRLETSCLPPDEEFYEEITCIENASCDEEFKCSCNEGYFSSDTHRGEKCFSMLGTKCETTADCITSHAECIEVNGAKICSCIEGYSIDPHRNDTAEEIGTECYGNHLSNCSVVRCNPNKFLSCRDYDTCLCESPSYYFDPEKDKCVATLNSVCKRGDYETYCPDNAQCNDYCECNDGYRGVHKGDKCFAGHGVQCDINEDCDPERNLQCACDKTCKCFDNYQYDSEIDKCRGFIGANCDYSQYSCIDRALCIETKCICGYGHSQHPSKNDNRCYPEYSFNCLNFGDEEHCNSWNNLECSNGVCECKGRLEYEYENCSSPYDNECDIKPSSERSQINCLRDLVCNVQDESDSNIGICKCPNDFKWSESGFCNFNPEPSSSNRIENFYKTILFTICCTLTLIFNNFLV